MKEIDIIDWLDKSGWKKAWNEWSSVEKENTFCKLYYFSHVSDAKNLKNLTQDELKNKMVIEKIIPKNPEIMWRIYKDHELRKYHETNFSDFHKIILSFHQDSYASYHHEFIEAKIHSFKNFQDLHTKLRTTHRETIVHFIDNLTAMDKSLKHNKDVLYYLISEYSNSYHNGGWGQFQYSSKIENLKNSKIPHILKEFIDDDDFFEKLRKAGSFLYEIFPEKIQNKQIFIEKIWRTEFAIHIPASYFSNPENYAYIKENFKALSSRDIQALNMPKIALEMIDDKFIEENIDILRYSYNQLPKKIQNDEKILLRIYDLKQNEVFNSFTKTNLKQINDQELKEKLISVHQKNPSSFHEFKVLIEEHIIKNSLNISESNQPKKIKKI